MSTNDNTAPTMQTASLKFTTSKTKGTERLKVTIRLNDECKNGHEDFAITAELFDITPKGERWSAVGCLHDEIARFFPEFAPFIALHLCNHEGVPMHGIANGFHWFSGLFADGLGQPYHPGAGSGAKTAEQCRAIVRDHLHTDEVTINTIIAAMPRTKEEFSFVLENLGMRERWKNEALAAIAQLEALATKDGTRPRFVSQATRNTWEPLTDQQRKQIEERQASGYYNPDQVAARDAEARAALRADREKALRAEHAKKTNEINGDLARSLYYLDTTHQGKNLIFYPHTNTIQANWTSTEKLWTEQEFNAFRTDAQEREGFQGLNFAFQPRPKH